jgi:hypothetical protein
MLMTVNRARGWRRIGVVLSVIWFIGFGDYIWVSEVGRIGEFYRWQLETCGKILSNANDGLQYIAKQEEREKRQSENRAKYKECQDSASSFHGSSNADLRKGIPLLLAVDLGTVAFGWLVVWLVTLVVRWVQRGFASV